MIKLLPMMTIRFVRIQLSTGQYECLVTNLPEDMFSASDLKELYGMRWGIETSFRKLKYTVGMLYFHSKKVEFIEQEIWARLLMYNFYSTVTNHIAHNKSNTKHKYQPNYTDIVHICRYFLKLSSDKAPPDIETLLLRGSLPIRPDRQYPRKKRMLPSVGLHYRVT